MRDTLQRPTRAYVLHPDAEIRQARRLPEHGLAEAVALAAALPELDVLWLRGRAPARSSPARCSARARWPS
jgi:GTP-binding protein HflX